MIVQEGESGINKSKVSKKYRGKKKFQGEFAMKNNNCIV